MLSNMNRRKFLKLTGTVVLEAHWHRGAGDICCGSTGRM